MDETKTPPTPVETPEVPAAITDPRIQPANPGMGTIADLLVKNKVKVTDRDKTEFFKCFLADKPYEEEFKLFNDEFKVTFRSLSVGENNDVFKQVIYDQQQGVPKTDEAYFVTLVTYRAATTISKLQGEPFQPELTRDNFKEDKEKGLTYVRARAAIFDTWPAFKLQALLEAFRVFELKVVHLTEQVTDPNFWKPEK